MFHFPLRMKRMAEQCFSLQLQYHLRSFDDLITLVLIRKVVP
ncbi:hypothetical protein NT03LS_0770 [Listeria seeligeri FSL N1-067]|uniref:Uncharacterized protein n=1 Tax=Listeria seeligeri FSL N1-067 TaxID=702453 RepID=E3ZMV3_LISSE|nr:hypothetical protein NT03LS_0770 [Listeria seeligeri FSL N1-067]